jgi:hypothetical protein
MHLTIFSGDAAYFAPNWKNETVIVLFGGARVDLTERPPANGATLSVYAVFGGAKVIVPAGSRVTTSGLSLFGGRRINVRHGDGPALHVRAAAIFGGVDVIEAPRAKQPETPSTDERVFRSQTGIKLADVGIQAG